MSNVAKLMLALVVLALAVPVVANPITDVSGPNSGPQTTTMNGDDSEIWLILYVDRDGSGTFNDRAEFIAARLIQPAQR